MGDLKSLLSVAVTLLPELITAFLLLSWELLSGAIVLVSDALSAEHGVVEACYASPDTDCCLVPGMLLLALLTHERARIRREDESAASDWAISYSA